MIFFGVSGAGILLAWSIVASISPNPVQEFNRIFGVENRSVVTDIETIKPTMMDGYFMSFRISKSSFEKRIEPQFKILEFTNSHLLRGQNRPSDWPKAVENAISAHHKKIDHDDVLVYYDDITGIAYVSMYYDQW